MQKCDSILVFKQFSLVWCSSPLSSCSLTLLELEQQPTSITASFEEVEEVVEEEADQRHSLILTLATIFYNSFLGVHADQKIDAVAEAKSSSNQWKFGTLLSEINSSFGFGWKLVNLGSNLHNKIWPFFSVYFLAIHSSVFPWNY